MSTMLNTAHPAEVDVFQASLLNLVHDASDIGIHHFFESKKNELNRFLIAQYICSLRPTHPLRSKQQHYPLSASQNLSFRENDSAAEATLQNEWSALLNFTEPKSNSNSNSNSKMQISTHRFDAPPPPKSSNPSSPLKFEFAQPSNSTAQTQSMDIIAHSCTDSQNVDLFAANDFAVSASTSDVLSENSNDNAADTETEIVFNYRSISRSCWIYIVQEFCEQSDKLHALPFLNRFFNDLSSDRLVWRELSLSAFQINDSIRHHHYAAFELFLSRSCTNLQSLDFECLAKDKLSWDTLWSLLSKHCLTLKHIHIGLYDGIWKFEFNQLKPIVEDLFRNVQRHIEPSNKEITNFVGENVVVENVVDGDVAIKGQIDDVDPDIAIREAANYLPITRIECAPGVMPTHIVSLLKRARVLEHFFVPLIYNDGDDRWDSEAFWEIPRTLPSTLKSFRGFDAQTPLRFVHECISNLPNIEEFHVVLYFGSAHPDFIACSMTSATLIHLSSNCKRLRSFEGYFHSTVNILEGIESMVRWCSNLQLIGLLFHPEVSDADIDRLITRIGDSKVCYQPKFSRLTENPNQHVQLRVVEISFSPKRRRAYLKRQRQLAKNKKAKFKKLRMLNQAAKQPAKLLSAHQSVRVPVTSHSAQMNLGPYAGISSKHLKSLDEIDSLEEDEQEDGQEQAEVCDEHANGNGNTNSNSHSHRAMDYTNTMSASNSDVRSDHSQQSMQSQDSVTMTQSQEMSSTEMSSVSKSGPANKGKDSKERD